MWLQFHIYRPLLKRFICDFILSLENANEGVTGLYALAGMPGGSLGKSTSSTRGRSERKPVQQTAVSEDLSVSARLDNINEADFFFEMS